MNQEEMYRIRKILQQYKGARPKGHNTGPVPIAAVSALSGVARWIIYEIINYGRYSWEGPYIKLAFIVDQIESGKIRFNKIGNTWKIEYTESYHARKELGLSQ